MPKWTHEYLFDFVVLFCSQDFLLFICCFVYRRLAFSPRGSKIWQKFIFQTLSVKLTLLGQVISKGTISRRIRIMLFLHSSPKFCAVFPKNYFSGAQKARYPHRWKMWFLSQFILMFSSPNMTHNFVLLSVNDNNYLQGLQDQRLQKYVWKCSSHVLSFICGIMCLLIYGSKDGNLLNMVS